jgi:hypothetical protein
VVASEKKVEALAKKNQGYPRENDSIMMGDVSTVKSNQLEGK